MQIDSAETLIQALRSSGLFTPEQMFEVAAELTALGADLHTLMRHLVNKNRLSVYQLRKVVHGKAAELLFGPYVISDKLGEGGMGKVFRATQVRVGREVALKVVRPALLSNPVVRKRYDREVESASSLDHPNIVRVYDAGEIEGKFYLAMEFVDGIDLSLLLRRHRPLEVIEACEYVRQAALGLQHAHEKGLVHRDIKPSNIVVSGERHVPQATEPAVVKILDMGLVRTVGFEDGNAGGDLTRAGTVVGTPDYMAPEQAKNSSTVDHRADLYSLGCTFYFLLTGQPPYPSGTPIEKLLKHQLDTPTPVQALRREVSDPIAAVVSRLLAKKADERIQTAGEVAELLADLSLYPAGAQPVRLRNRREKRGSGDSVQRTGSRSSGSSTAPPPGEDIPLAHPVLSEDNTPRPIGLGTVLHALPKQDTATPFSSFTDPPSGPLASIAGVEKARPAPARQPISSRTVWFAAGAAAVVGLGICLWVLLGTGSARTHADPPAENEPPPRSSPRPGLVPTANLSRFRPIASLLIDQPCLVVVAYPSLYLKEKESAFTRGSGPGRLVSWTDRLGVDTGLLLDRSERMVLSLAGGDSRTPLLVSEGDYLTPAFAAGLSKNARLAPFPWQSPPGAKLFREQGSGQRFTSLITASPSLYALSVGSPEPLTALASRIQKNEERPASADPAILAALQAQGDNPPLLLAAAGAALRLPFEFQSAERADTRLGDLGIVSMTLRVRILERMEVELAITGRGKEKTQTFLAWLKQKVADEYPRDGRIVSNWLTQAKQSSEELEGGASRLTLRLAPTPEQWSAFLECLFHG
jgi:serine/threonine-protein kinase